MSASIRGHQALIKAFKDNGDVNLLNITQFDVNQDASFSRSFYVGRSEGEGDTSFQGWSGSLSVEVKDSMVDDFIDALVTDNLNGIGVADYTLTDTEYYADGTSSTYVYFGLQWKMSKSVGTMDAKVTKKLDFQADGRLKV